MTNKMRTQKKRHKKVKSRSFSSPSWLQQSHYAWRNLVDYVRQNLLSCVLTLLVIAISVSLPTIIYLLWKNSNEAAAKWYPTPNMTVYVKTSLNSPQTEALQRQIETLESVKSIRYLSRDETLQEFKEWSGFSQAIDLLDSNPLPAVIVVSPTDEAIAAPDTLSQLQDDIKRFTGVDSVKMDSSWFTRLTALSGMVGSITFALSIMMIIAVFLVIGNSIRLNIFARCDTIKVMQLIGATEGFIYRPFLYNGAFFGFFGAILAIILTQLFIWQIDSAIADVSSMFGTNFSIQSLNWEEILLLLIVSTMIGWASAWIATTKYLKAHYV